MSAQKQGAIGLILLLTLCTSVPIAARAGTDSKTVPRKKGRLVRAKVSTVLVGASAPAFTLCDADGKARSLADYRGHRVVCFFFCGCSWCADVAREWARLQHGGGLVGAEEHAEAPVTVIVFSGSGEAGRDFAAQNGLVGAQTVLLADPDDRVTAGLYHAAVCPRVFVLDRRGIVRYTNNHADDQPRKAAAPVIIFCALDALQKNAATQTSALTIPKKRAGKP